MYIYTVILGGDKCRSHRHSARGFPISSQWVFFLWIRESTKMNQHRLLRDSQDKRKSTGFIPSRYSERNSWNYLQQKSVMYVDHAYQKIKKKKHLSTSTDLNRDLLNLLTSTARSLHFKFSTHGVWRDSRLHSGIFKSSFLLLAQAKIYSQSQTSIPPGVRMCKVATWQCWDTSLTFKNISSIKRTSSTSFRWRLIKSLITWLFGTETSKSSAP